MIPALALQIKHSTISTMHSRAERKLQEFTEATLSPVTFAPDMSPTATTRR